MKHKITADQTNNDPTNSNQKSPWEAAVSSAIQGFIHIFATRSFITLFTKHFAGSRLEPDDIIS